jgi:AcrR family transcriptional regulator
MQIRPDSSYETLQANLYQNGGRNMEKTDRRILRTRRLLGEALLDLIQEQPFDSITIRDITGRADIGYATFFRHYDSKEDLLSQQLEQIIRQLESVVGEHTDDYFQREGTLFYQHLQENELLYRGLLGGHVNVQVIRRLRDALVRVIRPHIKGNATDADLRIPLEIAVNHMAASVLEMAAWWLENDMPYSPEDMGRYYETLIVQATWQAILPQCACSDSAP